MIAFSLLIVGGTILVLQWPRLKDLWLSPASPPPSQEVPAVRPQPKQRAQPKRPAPAPPAPPLKALTPPDTPSPRTQEADIQRPDSQEPRAKEPTVKEPRSRETAREPDAEPQGRVAIVIDDLGWDPKAARALLEMDAPLTFAILPHLPHSEAVARWAREKRREILLHLPMEPHGYPAVDPGKGALLRGMDEATLESLLLQDLESIPGLVGVNNHMGSSFTEDDRRMRVVLKLLQRKGFFFLDSRTSPGSVAYRLAQELGLKAGRRQVFLDHGERADAKAVEAQLWRLVQIAQEKGQAIGIGHPHAYTLEALRRTLPRLKAHGVEVVPVSQLIN